MSAKKTLLYEFSSFLGMSLIFGLCVAFSWFLYNRLGDTFNTLDTYAKYCQDRYKEDTLKMLMVNNLEIPASVIDFDQHVEEPIHPQS
ncbi:MAG: hypothetical protein K0R24_1466 [Gammaproteobacteria bacterium]|jgi:hypothetical protein|nr:hypothetical protein [Gammaproteobacteria bacterium]